MNSSAWTGSKHEAQSMWERHAVNELVSMTAQFRRVSVVIPTLNERAALPSNLRRLLQDPFVDEVIVVDGGSTDGTLDFAADVVDARVTLVTSEPGRGLQMNAGARRASGDILLFHHADTQLPAGGIGAILERANTEAGRHRGRPFFGGFRHRFSDRNWKLRLISLMHNVRCRLSGVVYGDQSMFVDRRFFLSLGGFATTGLEDLDFCDRALMYTQSVLLKQHVVTESRKFRQMGEFRALAHVVSIVLRYERSRELANDAFFRPYR